MRANVATAAGAASQFRVGAPGGLHLAGRFKLGGQPALKIIGVHPADSSEQAGADDVAGQAASPMTQVSVRHAIGDLVFSNGGDEVIRFLEIQAKRLLAKDGDAGFDCFHRRVEVDVVGGDDDDVVELA